MRIDTIWLICVVLISAFVVDHGIAGRLEIFHEWRYLDWFSPSVQLVENNFTRGNALIQDVDVDRRGRVFVTSPKWPPGVPIALSTVTDLDGPGGPLLTPYPDWTWHKPNGCDYIVSAYRIVIDEYDRLWVVDIGRIETKTVCPTKILIFDLNTDQLIHKYVIPPDQTLNGGATLVAPALDIGDSPIDAFLYIADPLAFGIEVYDLKHDHSWRINNTRGNAFGWDKEATDLVILGEGMGNLTDGILGMALSPKGFFEKRYLYFNSLASYYQRITDTISLKNSEYQEPIIFQSQDRRTSHAGAQINSRRGISFFQLAEETALACWDITKPFTPENIVVLAKDEVALQYISSLKVIVNHLGEEELWFVTNRLQKTINKNRNSAEVNYRIIKGKVDDIVRGTNCDASGYHQAAPDLSSWLLI